MSQANLSHFCDLKTQCNLDGRQSPSIQILNYRMSEDEFQRQTDEKIKSKSSLKGASPDKVDDAFVKQMTDDADDRSKTEVRKKIRFAPVGPEEIR